MTFNKVYFNDNLLVFHVTFGSSTTFFFFLKGRFWKVLVGVNKIFKYVIDHKHSVVNLDSNHTNKLWYVKQESIATKFKIVSRNNNIPSN
jgi:hypothetical protein